MVLDLLWDLDIKMKKYLRIYKLYEHLHTIFIAKNMIYFKKIDSTNNFASRLINFQGKITEEKYYPPLNNGTVIIAEEQYFGKGRFGKKWISPPGGLWFSIILTPFYDKAYSRCENNILQDYKLLPEITLISAYSVIVSMKKFIINSMNKKKFFEDKFYIKWPNDIYFGDKKIAGILCETEKINGFLYLIIGIGINVNNKIINNYSGTEAFNLNAISLIEIFEILFKREELFSEIITEFEKNYLYYLKTKDFKSIFSKIKEGLLKF